MAARAALAAADVLAVDGVRVIIGATASEDAGAGTGAATSAAEVEEGTTATNGATLIEVAGVIKATTGCGRIGYTSRV